MYGYWRWFEGHKTVFNIQITTRIEINLRINPCLYAILVAIDAGLRAINPSFQIKVRPNKLQKLSNPKDKSLLISNPCSYFESILP